MITDKLKDKLMVPLGQSVILILCCLAVQLLALIFYSSNSSDGTSTAWIISAAFVLFFAFLNAIVVLQTDKLGSYVTRSFYGYFLILAANSGIAYIFTLGSTGGADSIRFILAIITFSYFIFLTIALLMRKIIEYAQRQDTEHKT